MSEKKEKGPQRGLTKEERLQNKHRKMEEDLEKAVLEGNQLVVANYNNYLTNLHKAAMGELKGVSPTNQLSSCKLLIEKAEKLMEKEKVKDDVPSSKDNPVAEVVDKGSENSAQLISLSFNG